MNKMIKKILLGIIGFIVFIIILVSVLPSSPQEAIVPVNSEIKETLETQQETPNVLDNISVVENENIKIPSKKEETTSKIEEKLETTTTPSVNPEYTYYSVTDVVDGDTIKINLDGKVTTLRLIGLDTPETVDPRKPVQCFGIEASNKAEELLSSKKVRIEKDPTQGELDKYGRLLTYVYRDDGLFYNKYMIEQGYAHEYTYDLPYKYQAEFKQAQKSAQENLLGLWSPSTCNGDTTSSSTTQTPPPATTTSSGKYYTSSYYSSKYYYPESCDGWKSLSKKYLRDFNSLNELLAEYPSKTKSPQCE